jgi:hypothetical protein
MRVLAEAIVWRAIESAFWFAAPLIFLLICLF